MQPSPLPDFRLFRLQCRLASGGIFVVFYLACGVIEPDIFVFWAFIGAVYGTILFGIQSLALAGDGAPHLPLNAYAVHLLAMCCGIVDSIFAWAWYSVIGIMLNSMGYSTDWMDGNSGWAILGGLLMGWMAFLFIGLKFPRYEFLRLIFWMHLFGAGLMLAVHLYNVFGEYQLSDGSARNTLELVGYWGIAATLTLSLWGVVPAAYLWAFRNYRTRMNIAELHVEDDDVEAIFPSENNYSNYNHAPDQPIQTA